MDEKDKPMCRHAPCTCPAPTSQDYCCEWCEKADARKDPTDIHCHCGHEHCGGEPVALDTNSLLMASPA